MATTTLVATETGTPGNHSICFARRITTDPLKMQVTRQSERQREREKREREKKITNGKPWLVAKVTQRQALFETSLCYWPTERGAEL